jgi:hypothetical protein
MKRLSIAIAVITAVVVLVAYQIIFRDRRSRLRIDSTRQLPVSAVSFNYSNQKLDRVSTPDGRMLVYNGAIEFEVDSALRARDAIKKIVEGLGGYVLSERQDDYGGGNVHFTQSIRIPSEATEEVVRRIEGLAGKIKAKRMSAIDVTEEFIDIGSRVRTKKKAEARYQEIIKEAKTVEDIIKIEDKIAIVRGEIESMEGRLKYLENQVALATLDIEFYEPGGGAVAGFGYKVVSSLKNGWEGLLVCIATIANIWPILVMSALGWIYRRRVKKVIASVAN